MNQHCIFCLSKIPISDSTNSILKRKFPTFLIVHPILDIQKETWERLHSSFDRNCNLHEHKLEELVNVCGECEHLVVSFEREFHSKIGEWKKNAKAIKVQLKERIIQSSNSNRDTDDFEGDFMVWKKLREEVVMETRKKSKRKMEFLQYYPPRKQFYMDKTSSPSTFTSATKTDGSRAQEVSQPETEAVPVESLTEELMAANVLLQLQKQSKSNAVKTIESEPESGALLLSQEKEGVAFQPQKPQPLSESESTKFLVATDNQEDTPEHEQPPSFQDNQHPQNNQEVAEVHRGRQLEMIFDISNDQQRLPCAVAKDNKLFVLVDRIEMGMCENCGCECESRNLLAHSVDPLQCHFAFPNLSNSKEGGKLTTYFRCWYCTKVFNHVNLELQSHVIKEHPSMLTKKPPPPNPVVIMLDTSNPHFAILREEHFTKYLCKSCPAFGFNEEEMVEHVMLHVREVGEYCSSCWWLIAHGKLEEHEEKHHFPQQEGKCISSDGKLTWKQTEKRICRKCPALILKKDLPRHMELHTNPFSGACTECGIVMECNKLLLKHMPFYHLEQKRDSEVARIVEDEASAGVITNDNIGQ